MSFLFPLPIRGSGTVDVGCCGSHIHRLAQAHGVTVGRLLQDTFRWYGISNSVFRETMPAFKSNGGLAVYARPNDTTKAIVEVFTAATVQPALRSTTFLPLAGALQRSSNTFNPNFHWCSMCMGEFRMTGDPGYFKLYWLLRHITNCPIHGTPLVNTCPHCGKTQGGMSFRIHCRLCQSCGKELGQTSVDSDRAGSWEIQGTDLLDLVSVIANNPELEFPDDGVNRVASHLFEKVWASKEELRLWKTIPEHECICLAHKEMPVSLLIARRVAHYLSMSLPDLLAGSIDAASHVLDPTWTQGLPDTIKPKKRRPSRDREKVLKAVVQTIKAIGAEAPPPLVVIAEKVGVSTGYLNHHFPVLAKDIVRAHQDWAIEEMRKKHHLARLEAFKFFRKPGYSGKHYSRKQALVEIRNRTSLPKNLLREEINSVYRILF